MKLSNFLRFDPNYKGKGLERGNRLEKEIWDEFSSDHFRLREVASAIIRSAQSIPPPTDDLEAEEDENEEFPEGRILTQLHKRRERNPRLTKKKKMSVLKQSGTLACEVCQFDFQATYGELGRGFAECHHNRPLSALSKERRTRLADLSIVCANCHRMLHRKRPWETTQGLKLSISRTKVVK